MSEQPLADRFLRRRQLPAIFHPIEGELEITAARPTRVGFRDSKARPSDNSCLDKLGESAQRH